jgi:hypothetical protein
MDDPAGINKTAGNEQQGTGQTQNKVETTSGDSLRSLTRLVIGGVEVGYDELVRLLRVWEQEVSQLQSASPAGAASEIVSRDPSSPGPAGSSPSGQNQKSGAVETLRFALIGLLFETQERARKSAANLGRIERWVGRLADPWLRTSGVIYHISVLSPARRRYEQLVSRGEAELARWVALGRVEDAHSRALAQVAFDKTVDEYIEYLTTNPEVQELVQQQSTGLANEVIEEVRERTVSIDNLLEGMTRSVLRRMPRAVLPAPPETLRMSASPHHLQKNKRKPG